MLRELIEKHGYAIKPKVIAAEEIARLLKKIAAAGMPRSRAGIRHALKNSDVAELARDSRLLGIAQSVLGPDALPFRATLFDKSPAANWLVVWHQDTALPLRERRETPGWGPWSVKDGVIYAHAPASALSQVLALRVHLDDSMKANGPLRVLDGTHTFGVLTDEQLHELSVRVAPVDCLVQAGGVLAIRPLIVHASSKSQTEEPRRVLHIEYARRMEIEEGHLLAEA
jgi:ectoine hydroxylase-related dioxygenase (phytanoyl-CoA dioxygenase family)